MSRRYGQYDPHMVDELAVQFACNGTVMPLNRDEITVATIRMVGKVSTAEIARRCRADERQITRTLHALGARRCLICQQLTLQPDGIVARHIDYRWLEQCAASNRPADAELEVAS